MFRLPGASDRTVIIGPTGSGKTVGGAWLLSCQRLDKRPWVALDFKEEEFWDRVGDPPMKELRLGSMPGKRGLYRMPVNPGDEDALESWLWKVWHKGNLGLFIDEVSLVPQRRAFKAILRQGRSKRIPVISCTQRPVDCDREVFSESQFRMLYGIGDPYRDYPVIRGLFGDIGEHGINVRKKLPRHWSYWYDEPEDKLSTLRPVPSPDNIAASLKGSTPFNWFLGDKPRAIA